MGKMNVVFPLWSCRACETGVFLASSILMSDSPQLPTVPIAVRTVDSDTVYEALGEPSRRRILVALFDGRPRRAAELGSAIGKRLDTTVKHLDVLKKAGMVVTADDPTDRRRQVYTLAPFAKTETTPQGRTIDFGYCLMRI